MYIIIKDVDNMNFKYILKRFGAYLIDFCLVVLVVQAIVGTKILNPIYDKYVNSSNEYSYFTFDYLKMTSVLKSYYEDKVLSQEEYDTLIKDNSNFGYLLVEKYEDLVLSEEEYNSISEEVERIYNLQYEDLYYQANKNLWYYYLVFIIVVILYFGVFNYVTSGKTLGKKLMHLKVVSRSDKRVSLGVFILRSLVLYSGIFYLASFFNCLLASKETFGVVLSIFSLLDKVISMAIMFSILINKEGLGLHDIIFKTKVIEE